MRQEALLKSMNDEKILIQLYEVDPDTDDPNEPSYFDLRVTDLATGSGLRGGGRQNTYFKAKVRFEALCNQYIEFGPTVRRQDSDVTPPEPEQTSEYVSNPMFGTF